MLPDAESIRIQLPSFDLQDRCAVVTGASEGIGQAIAEAFAMAGASLALVSRDPNRLGDTAARTQAHGSRTTLHKADVCYIDQIARLATEVLEMHGQVTILVNSAGAPIASMALEVQEEEWDKVIDTGLKGVFFSCTAFGKAMIEQGYGKIINLSSTYAESVRPTQSVYSIAKGGLSMLTRALALEWAQHGVLVNALAPTLTDTPTRHHIVANEESRKRVEAQIPLGRYGLPQDLIGAAIFLASEASDFLTGQTIFVDGGWNAAQ
jgi:NAD(P)-dependent dehydrogenase (short-subunit alcohol dehydrogenase family)